MTDTPLAPPPGYSDAATTAPAAPSGQLAPPPGYSEAPAPQAQQTQSAAPEEPGTATKVANQIATGATDIGTGFAKGVEDTTAGIGSLIQKIPGVGPALIPQSGLAAEEQQAKIDQKAPGHIGQDIGK